ncbi:MAG: allantoinase [Gammaproteobacteria bacterium]|jgi:allantoinase
MDEPTLPEPRGPGMDNPHYDFSALPTRAKWVWPNDASLAVAVVLYLEHWELLPPDDAVLDQRLARAHGGGFFPETRAHSYREYGPRVGIYRVLETLDRHGIRASVAINASACERYPNLVAECQERGYEFVAHGTHATRMISSAMSEAEERGYIETTLETITKSTGTRPNGWLGQDYGESVRTPNLLATAGINYLLDWPNDDQPYLLRTDPAIVSVPNSPSLDDVQTLWLGGLSHIRYPAVVADTLATLRQEGAHSGRMCTLGIHPWMLGRAHRIRYLDAALATVSGQDGIWQTFAGGIADHARSLLGPTAR